MKIIKPSVEIISPINGQDILAHIERCGRVCYKSEGKITEGSAERFVRNIIKSGHESVLEHASFCFEVGALGWRYLRNTDMWLETTIPEYKSFLRYTDFDDRQLVSGNVRAWRNFVKFQLIKFNFLPFALKDFIESNPVLFPEYQNSQYGGYGSYVIKIGVDDLKTVEERLVHQDESVIFTCNRGVSHEIVRHREAGYSQESTRYCNYSRDDFGAEITVIQPCFLEPDTEAWYDWYATCLLGQKGYFDMLNAGCTAQEARDVLPHATKTEVVTTANLNEWRHFLRLRTSSAAHPQMREVAKMLLEQVREKIPVVFDDI